MKSFNENEIVAVAKTMKSNGENAALIDRFVEALGIQSDDREYVFTFRVSAELLGYSCNDNDLLSDFESLLSNYNPGDIDGFSFSVDRLNAAQSPFPQLKSESKVRPDISYEVNYTNTGDVDKVVVESTTDGTKITFAPRERNTVEALVTFLEDAGVFDE